MLRWLNFLAPAGAVLATTQKIVPPIAAAGLTTASTTRPPSWRRGCLARGAGARR